MLRAHEPKRKTASEGKRASKKVLSLEKIKSKYHAEWVLIKDPVVDRELRVVKGEVVFHSKDRDEVDRKAIELKLKHSAFLYTGPMPENVAINL